MTQWNPRDLVDNLRRIRLFVQSGDGGGGDPGSFIQESTVRRTNDGLFGDLRARGIGVAYRFTPGGQHTWDFWRQYFSNDINGIIASLPHQ
ncbi:MAG: hypothetical protein WKF57_15585 [Nakamurella sp.]